MSSQVSRLQSQYDLLLNRLGPPASAAPVRESPTGGGESAAAAPPRRDDPPDAAVSPDVPAAANTSAPQRPGKVHPERMRICTLAALLPPSAVKGMWILQRGLRTLNFVDVCTCVAPGIGSPVTRGPPSAGTPSPIPAPSVSRTPPSWRSTPPAHRRRADSLLADAPPEVQRAAGNALVSAVMEAVKRTAHVAEPSFSASSVSPMAFSDGTPGQQGPTLVAADLALCCKRTLLILT